MLTASPELLARLGLFIGTFALMALLEWRWPRRPLRAPKAQRWLTNVGLVVLNSAFLRLVFPVLAVGTALYARNRGWGLFNLVDLPVWLEIILAVGLLDLAIYAQHVAAHKIPLLWRLHQVHHADPDIDLTTGARFHPLEIAFSMLYKMAVVIVLGAHPLAVIIFEIILSSAAMFNHANFALPDWLDRKLRPFIVTPDFHRVHHSVIPRETDSNYGFNLAIWDHLFHTYTAQPKEGHLGMTIGLKQYPGLEPARLDWCLTRPFGAQNSSSGK